MRFIPLHLWCVLCTFAVNAFAPTQNAIAHSAPRVLFTAADSARAVSTFQHAVDKILDNKTLRATKMGVSIVSLENDKPMYIRNGNQQLTPASTTKLFSTFAALHRFGAEHIVRTTVYADGAVQNGVLRGNVYLVGNGDALLTPSDIEQLALQIAGHGIKEIQGNVYGDGSAFDALTERTQYSGDREMVEPLAPISALTLARNSMTVTVAGGAGAKPTVSCYPMSSSMSFVINATVKKRGKSVSITPKFSGNKVQFVVNGTIGRGASVSRSFVIRNPELFAAGTLYSQLRSHGIRVAGSVEERKMPAGTRNARVAEVGRPLADIVAHVNKRSDNFVAEHVLKIAGSKMNKSSSGTTFASNNAREAVNYLNSVLSSFDIPFNTCSINDGSGLSRRNVVTPNVLVRLLSVAAQSPFATAFSASLSFAGIDGTLEHRMRGTPAVGNVAAKTGTLRNVSALAGYARTRDGERMAFSLMFNGGNVHAYKAIENRIAALLADFSYQSYSVGVAVR